MTIPNICIGVCKMHILHKICKGCYRTPLELRQWHSANDARKLQIVENCETRKEIFGELNAN